MPKTRGDVAATVRAEIARRDLARKRVATALNLSPYSLSRRLRGEVAFDVDEILALSQLLEVPTARLLGEDAA